MNKCKAWIYEKVDSQNAVSHGVEELEKLSVLTESKLGDFPIYKTYSARSNYHNV